MKRVAILPSRRATKRGRVLKNCSMWNGMHKSPTGLPGSPDTRVRLSEAAGPAPRVTVRQAAAGQVIEPILDAAANPEDFHAAFLASFGTGDSVVAEALFGQLLNVLQTEP